MAAGGWLLEGKQQVPDLLGAQARAQRGHQVGEAGECCMEEGGVGMCYTLRCNRWSYHPLPGRRVE